MESEPDNMKKGSNLCKNLVYEQLFLVYDLDINVVMLHFFHYYLAHFITPLCEMTLGLVRCLGAEQHSSAYTLAVQMWATLSLFSGLLTSLQHLQLLAKHMTLI